MKTIFFLIFAVMVWGRMSAAARIDVMSNVSHGKMFFSLTAETPKEVSALIQMDTGTFEKTLVSLPKEKDGEETIGLLLLSDRLFLISQRTVSGGREPHVYQYSLTDREWKLAGQIPCISFSDVEIKKSKLTVDCEEDSFKADSAGRKSVVIETKKKDEVKASLPILRQEKDGVSYVLAGPKGLFNAVEIQKHGKDKKVISVEELSKAQK